MTTAPTRQISVPVSADRLEFPENNLLDGRVYETLQPPIFLYPNDLRRGDVITDGVGTYQVTDVGDWTGIPPGNSNREYIRHIRIGHTLGGPVMGGLIRGRLEFVQVLGRTRDLEATS